MHIKFPHFPRLPHRIILNGGALAFGRAWGQASNQQFPRTVMARILLCITAVLMPVGSSDLIAQVARPQLIDQTAAARHGLTRAWFAHVRVGGGRWPIVEVKFDAGTVFVQTGIGTVHAIDGNTGRTLWSAD